MWFYFVKVIVTALIVVAVSELAKRDSGMAALLASLPLVSLLAFMWMRLEGVNSEKIAALSQEIFWLVLPSLLLFILLPWLLKLGLSFWLSLGLACAATSVFYGLIMATLSRLPGFH